MYIFIYIYIYTYICIYNDMYIIMYICICIYIHIRLYNPLHQLTRHRNDLGHSDPLRTNERQHQLVCCVTMAQLSPTPQLHTRPLHVRTSVWLYPQATITAGDPPYISFPFPSRVKGLNHVADTPFYRIKYDISSIFVAINVCISCLTNYTFV